MPTLKVIKTSCDIHFDGAYAHIRTKLPPLVYQALRESLSYVDKRISMANRFRRWQQNPTVCLYDSQLHKFPTGLLSRADNVLKSNEIYPIYKRLIPYVSHQEPIELPDWLYPHQKEIIKVALAARRGTIESPTGSGKTKAAIYYLANLRKIIKPESGVPQLILTVPNMDLLAKTVTELETYLEEPIGTVSGKKKLWRRITVGVINSLAKQAQANPQFFSQVLGICYDEAHLAATSMYKQFSNACINSNYRLGLTGTLLRESGDELEMEGIIGAALYHVRESELYVLNKNNQSVIIKPDYLCIPVPDPKLKYQGAIPCGYDAKKNPIYKYKTHNEKPPRDEVYVKCIVENSLRNKMIICLIKTFLESPRRIGTALVLVEHIAHGEYLHKLAKQAGIDLPFVHGSSPIDQRNEYVRKLISGEQEALCASRIFNMGTDIPNLEFLVIGSGGAATTRVVQQFGRTTRKAEGKTRAVVVDFADEEQFYLRYNFVQRSRAIEKRYPGSKKIMSLKQVLDIL